MLGRLSSRLGFPTIGHHRRFVTAIGVDALGSGVFMPLTMLYFLAVTPLSVVQVGLALSVAAGTGLPAGPLIGSLVDRWGAKRVLLAGNVLQAGGMIGYLFAQSFSAVLLCTIVVTLGRTSFWGSYGNIVTAISSSGERERWFGFLGALRNVGFAVGGLLAGGAASVGTEVAFHLVVAANAASYLMSWWLLLAVPDARPGRSEGLRAGSWAQVLADRPYFILVLAQVLYAFPMMTLNTALPVYAVGVLGLPGWLVGALFTINCVMVGFGQGLVVEAMRGRVRARMLLVSQVAFGASFGLYLIAGWLGVVLATATMVVATVVYTCGELIGGPVLSATAAEAAPEDLRGRYLSLSQVAWGISGTIAPVLFAWLLDRGSEPLWILMLVISALALVVSARTARVLPAAAARVSQPAGSPSG